jgi:hypothetical protein
MQLTTNRLSSIATRQRAGRLRDVAFAALLALAGGIAMSAVATAVQAAQSMH